MVEPPSRRLSKDYEEMADTGQAMSYIAMTRLMLRMTQALMNFQTASKQNLDNGDVSGQWK